MHPTDNKFPRPWDFNQERLFLKKIWVSSQGTTADSKTKSLL